MKLVAAVGLSAVFAVGVSLLALHLASRYLRTRIVQALGPLARVESVRVGWSGVTIRGLRIAGPDGWPARDAARADEVRVAPSLGRLLRGTVEIGQVHVVRPYLSALRRRDGKFRFLPDVLEAQRKGDGGAGARLQIARVVFEDGTLEIFDATVAQPPLPLRLEQLHASIDEIAVPAIGRTRFDVNGMLKGHRRDGQVRVRGWVEAAAHDLWVKTELRGGDLVTLQPYLTRAADARVRRGQLDLDLTSEVRANRLRAPGRVTIADLEFASGASAVDTFLGVPRAAVLNLLRDKDGRITLDFVVEGDLDNPQFTLREALTTRLATGLAEHLGLSVRGVAEGLGSLGRKGAEAVGDTVKGIGSALRRVFNGGKKGP